MPVQKSLETYLKHLVYVSFYVKSLDVYMYIYTGTSGVMVIIAGIGHGNTSSNPGLIAFHIALIPLGKV